MNPDPSPNRNNLNNLLDTINIIIHYVYDLRFDWLATCK